MNSTSDESVNPPLTESAGMNHSFIKNRDIVLFSFQPWDTETGSNFKDMAEELARENRVLFFDRANDRASLWRKRRYPEIKRRIARLTSKGGEIEKIQANLWLYHPTTIVESINRIPFNWLFDMLNRMNNKRLAREINHVISRLGFSDVILINDNDFIRGRYLKQLVSCTDYLFYLRDYLLGIPYFQRHGPRLESHTLQTADIVLANSHYLADYAKRFNPWSFDIGQGCSTANVTAPVSSIPEDIRQVKKPVIGYTGYISAWRIDVDIIRYIAENLTGCSIVLIGPVDELLDTKKLQGYPNIYFLDKKAPAQLPEYIHYFDVCINPQMLNETTRGNYPRKIDEYLAMGKPVVATRTETMAIFEPYTFLCTTREEYVEKIKEILASPGKKNSEEEQERRRSFSKTHTWTESIGRLGDAYAIVKNSKTARMIEQKGADFKKNRLHFVAIVFVAMYLVVIFIKFLFF